MSAKDFPLSNLQEWMQQVLIDPQGLGGKAPGERLPDHLQDGALEQIIKPGKRMSAAKHLGIYQRSYIARLRDCMIQQFGALQYALGEELFQSFVDEYLHRYPSTSYTLHDLGLKFPDFLEETRPDKEAKEDWPDFMIELAQFEYQINLIFDQKADEDYTLASKETHEDQLALLPVFHLFQHRFPISWYYKAYLQKQDPQLPNLHSSFCAVTRKDYKLGLYELRPEQYVFLSYLKQVDTVSDAKELMFSNHGFDPEKFEEVWQVWKERWTEAGFFSEK